MEAGGDDATAVRTAFEVPDNTTIAEFMWYVSDIFTESVQYGGRTALCDYLVQIAPNATYDNLATWAKGRGVVMADYAIKDA